MSLNYDDRCRRYARQRGWRYDPHGINIHRPTPRQRRRYRHKLRRELGTFLAGDGHYPGDQVRPADYPAKRYTQSGGGRPRLLPRKTAQAERWHGEPGTYRQWLKRLRRTATKGRPTPRQRRRALKKEGHRWPLPRPVSS